MIPGSECRSGSSSRKGSRKGTSTPKGADQSDHACEEEKSTILIANIQITACQAQMYAIECEEIAVNQKLFLLKPEMNKVWKDWYFNLPWRAFAMIQLACSLLPYFLLIGP